MTTPSSINLMGKSFTPESTHIGKYLIDRLYDLGVRHIFGIPGDYILGFCKLVEDSNIKWVGTTSELSAGFAADGCARVNGLGVACVTYNVGGLSLANAVGCAYAEKSPVVIISGSPGLRERKPEVLLHHTVGRFSTQRDVFQHLTVASCSLEDPLTAFREIDRVLFACLRYKLPVYIEIPRDRLTQAPLHNHVIVDEHVQSDPAALKEAVEEATGLLSKSIAPVIIAGIEVHRFGLQNQMLKFAEANHIPMASLLLSKSVVRENHPLYAGVYEAAMGRPEVTKFVEESDLMLMLGAFLDDIDTAIFTHNIDPGKTVFVSGEEVRIRHHRYPNVMFKDFLKGLNKMEPIRPKRPLPVSTDPIYSPWKADPDAKITIMRLFQKINSILDEDKIVIADPGDALFGASDLTMYRGADFLSPAFYTSLGFAVPAALGAQCAKPKLRPIILSGDGSFQINGMELSTSARLGFNPICIILNNEGYSTERFLLDGKFNDVANWNFHKLPELYGSGMGFEVKTEGELDNALTKSLANTTSFSILNVRLDKSDASPALKRLAERLAKRV